MRFIVDECTGPTVAQWLRQNGHDVFSVYEEARGLDDESILQKAATDDRVLITNDKDFGEMIFRQRREHNRVDLLRLQDERRPNKIEVLEHLLQRYADQIPRSFVVATESAVRIARPRDES